MRNFINKTILISLIITAMSLFVWAAGEKRIFINGFTADGIGESRKNTTERVFKEEFINNGFRIADEASIKAGLKMESLKMGVGSNDENTLKKIMASSDVDYIVYGYVRAKQDYIFITAKMLDKSNNEIKLGRVKTIRMKKELAERFYEEGCRVLAVYLISDESGKVQKFQDKMISEERLYEKTIKQGILAGEESIANEEFRRKVEEYKQERYDKITGNHSWFRGGYNLRELTTGNVEFDTHFKPGRQFFFEWDVPVYDESMVGIDLLARYTCRYFSKRKNVSNTLTDEKLARDFDERKRTVFDSVDFGLRVRLGVYFLMTKFDIYGIAALGINEGAFNAMYGGGFEVAFFPHVGFFIEYNRGTTSVTDLDLDIANNSQVLVGSTFRFSLGGCLTK